MREFYIFKQNIISHNHFPFSSQDQPELLMTPWQQQALRNNNVNEHYVWGWKEHYNHCDCVLINSCMSLNHSKSTEERNNETSKQRNQAKNKSFSHTDKILLLIHHIYTETFKPMYLYNAVVMQHMKTLKGTFFKYGPKLKDLHHFKVPKHFTSHKYLPAHLLY